MPRYYQPSLPGLDYLTLTATIEDPDDDVDLYPYADEDDWPREEYR